MNFKNLVIKSIFFRWSFVCKNVWWSKVSFLVIRINDTLSLLSKRTTRWHWSDFHGGQKSLFFFFWLGKIVPTRVQHVHVWFCGQNINVSHGEALRNKNCFEQAFTRSSHFLINRNELNKKYQNNLSHGISLFYTLATMFP